MEPLWGVLTHLRHGHKDSPPEGVKVDNRVKVPSAVLRQERVVMVRAQAGPEGPVQAPNPLPSGPRMRN